MKKPFRKSVRRRQRPQSRPAQLIPEEAPERASMPRALPSLIEDNDFLTIQTARLLEMFPDKTLKSAHRKGLSVFLTYVYNMWILLQLIRGIPSDRAIHLARAYVARLRPRSFKEFSVLTTRGARQPPVALLVFRNLYSGILPMVQSTCRDGRELDLESAGYTDQDIARQLAESLLSQFKGRSPRVAHRLSPFVTADLFLDQSGISKPHQVARLLAARLVGLGDRSQVTLERYLKAARQASWRVPEWETPEAKALAEQPFSRPS